MAQRDIIVRRVQGARAVPVPVGAPIVIPAVICRTLGKQTLDNVSITRGSQTYDTLCDKGLKTPLNAFVEATYTYSWGTGKSETFTFKPGVHFRFAELTDSATPEIRQYLSYENLYITELKYSSGNCRYAIDWSQAPLLSSPQFDVQEILLTSGGLTGGEYIVYVYAKGFDENYSQSLVKKITIAVGAGEHKGIRVIWKKVAYASGYKVVLAKGTAYSAVDVDPDVFTYDFTDEPAETEPSITFGAKQVPPQGENYTLTYRYLTKLTNTPVLYSSLDQVREDHGIGSEAYNIARYFLSTEYGGAPFVVLVAVEEDSPAGYMQALSTLENENVHLVFATYWDMDLFDSMYMHCVSLSDPASGQRERYAVFASKGDWNWYDNELKSFLQRYRAMEKYGKRGFFVVFDGGEIELDTWIEMDGSITTGKKVFDPAGVDITPLFGAMLAFARYCSFRDPASSLTEKNIPGIRFKQKPWGDDVYLYLRELGAMVMRNDFQAPVCDLDINMSYGLLGLNDSQLPIAMTEDWMKQDLRNRLKVFRGKKNIELSLESVINYMKLILDGYVSAGLITAYDEGSLKVEILSTGQLKGFFKYTPVIIINQVLFEYDFEFIL